MSHSPAPGKREREREVFFPSFLPFFLDNFLSLGIGEEAGNLGKRV
jgi:hypothetical protein